MHTFKVPNNVKAPLKLEEVLCIHVILCLWRKLGPEGWVQLCRLCEAGPGLDSESPDFCFRFLPLHYFFLPTTNLSKGNGGWGWGGLTVRKHRPLWEG